MKTKYADLWTQYNYLFYVVDGSKTWHTARGATEITKGSCIFVRKGGFILEQALDEGFCVVLFFIPDEFICDTLKSKSRGMLPGERRYDQLMPVDLTESLRLFFMSMSAYFGEEAEPDRALLELKFRELILTMADNPKNIDLLSYFCALMSEPKSQTLQRVMEENFCFNLSLEQFARLANRSVSAFKRDFQKHYQTSPGKWLLEQRLQRAAGLLKNAGKSPADAAFESGFENHSHFSRVFRERFGCSPSAAKTMS